MINDLYSSVDGTTTAYRGQGTFGMSDLSQQEIRASGVLHNFYILDTWFDPERHAVWTLAVARKPD